MRIERLDSAATALMLMDFQNDIVDPDGRFGSQGVAEQVRRTGAIENAARALAAARAEAVEVIHVGVGWREGHPELNASAPLFAAGKQGNMLVEGGWGIRFHPELAPEDGELVVRKRSVSALAGTELDRYLRLRGIRTLALCGVLTNFVVEGTAREAVDRGYEVIVLGDCCAALDDEKHRFSLEVILPMLGTVTTSDAFAHALTAEPAVST
jgi:nicotinamidase-related amidase